MQERVWRKCNPNAFLVGIYSMENNIQLLWRTVWRFLKKLRIELPELPYDPATPLLGIYPEKIIVF